MTEHRKPGFHEVFKNGVSTGIAIFSDIPSTTVANLLLKSVAISRLAESCPVAGKKYMNTITTDNDDFFSNLAKRVNSDQPPLPTSQTQTEYPESPQCSGNDDLDEMLGGIESEPEHQPTEEEADSILDQLLGGQSTEPKPNFSDIAQSSTHAEELNRLIALVKRGDAEATFRLAYECYADDLLDEFDPKDEQSVARLLRAAARQADDPLNKIPKKAWAEHRQKTGHGLGTVPEEIDALLDSLDIPHDGPVEMFDHD